MKFPRTTDKMVVLAGDVWNDLVEEVERLGKWSVAAPLQLSNGPGGFGLATKTGERFVRLKITATVSPGVYHAKTYTSAFATSSVLSEGVLGTLAAENDAFAWDLASIGLATALPLDGLITEGRIVGRDDATGKLIVQIPPPAVRDVRYDALTDRLQVSYVSNPTSGHWTDKVNFTPCP